MDKLILTCCPGIEQIASLEILTKLNCPSETTRGQVLFEANAKEAIEKLKCADNIYYYVSTFVIGRTRNDLKQLNINTKEIVNALDYLAKEKLIPPKPWKLHISCARSGDHTFSRFEAASAFGNCFTNIDIVDKNNLNVALRLDIMENKATVAIKLTDSSFRFRGNRNFSSGALRPPLAHALIILSNPSKWETFVDPFCGSGTIAAERALYEAGRIVCGDINLDAAKIAIDNSPTAVEVNVWNATALPFENNSVDTIVTNPPWNMQIQVEDLTQLIEDFFKEAKRVLKINGKIILISDNESLIIDTAKKANLFYEQNALVSVHGTLCYIFTLKKSIQVC